MMKSIRFAVAIGSLIVPALCAAQSSPAQEEHHHGPSPESIAACKDKTEGSACEYDAARGHEAGTCHKDRSGDLACFHPHHHHDQDGGAR